MIGFFGGSFDPVHYGHLHHARNIKQELCLTQLFLMPCHTPVHKAGLHFSAAQRLTMLNLAMQEFSDLSIDTREIKAKKPAYTIDTLKHIKQQYPTQKIFFIMGGDSFASLHTWRDYEQLDHYAQLVVLPRKTTTRNGPCPLESDIYFAKTPLVDISSTKIRSKIQHHQNLSDLMPKAVIDYIQQL